MFNALVVSIEKCDILYVQWVLCSMFFIELTFFFSLLLHHCFRFCGAEFSGPDPPAQVLLARDPDVGPDVEVGGSSRKTDLLSRLQTQQVSRFFLHFSPHILLPTAEC